VNGEVAGLVAGEVEEALEDLAAGHREAAAPEEAGRIEERIAWKKIWLNSLMD
jgi:hypothetical protein